MKRLFIVLIIFFTIVITAKSQGGTLEFNRVLIISDSAQVVPSGKVWKVMSLYGKQADQCTLDPLNIWGGSYYWKYKSRGFQVNGVTVWQQISEATFDIKSTSDCSGSNYTTRAWSDAQALQFKNEVGHQTAADLESLLPFWLPAGVSVNSISDQQYLSVLEFNIIP